MADQPEKFVFEELQAINDKIKATPGVPDELRFRMTQMLQRLERMAKLGHYATEFDNISHYIETVLQIPWTANNKRSI
jgi:ATP-dependent Lon protease